MLALLGLIAAYFIVGTVVIGGVYLFNKAWGKFFK